MSLRSLRRLLLVAAGLSVALTGSMSLAGRTPAAPVMVDDLLVGTGVGDSEPPPTTMATFSKTSGTAGVVAKVTMSYFTSATCTGAAAGSYSTPNGPTYTITTGVPFRLSAESAWTIGSANLGLGAMTAIQSIAVVLKSTTNNTPQSNFSNVNFACLSVTCTAGPAGTCTSASGTQSFTLNTTASVGDPVDGGIIACLNTGVAPRLYDLIINPTADQVGGVYGVNGIVTGATSTTDGAANTALVVAAGGASAASTCNSYSATGGYTTGWFLASGGDASSQSSCVIANNALADGSFGNYQTSTEIDATQAWRVRTDGVFFAENKPGPPNRGIRCVKVFTQ